MGVAGRLEGDDVRNSPSLRVLVGGDREVDLTTGVVDDRGHDHDVRP